MEESDRLTDSTAPLSGDPDSPRPAAHLAQLEIADVPVCELFRAVPRGDYRAHTRVTKAFFALLSQDRERLAKFSADVDRIIQQMSDPQDLKRTKQRFRRKDVSGRFSRLVQARQRLAAQPSLLSGSDFDECLLQYKALIAHVESMWADACNLHRQENYPLAAFLAVLAIEEIGKLTHLYEDLLHSEVERPAPRSVDENHKRKQLIGVFAGALINERLDRVIGFDVVRKLLHMAESGGLERLRQDCLYIDVQDGRAVTPRERIEANCARILTVFAGEVMAEVLGHFPWEFERMLNDVIAYERSIGMPDKKILG